MVNGVSKEEHLIESSNEDFFFDNEIVRKVEKRKSNMDIQNEFMLVPKCSRISYIDEEQCDVFGNFVASELKNLKMGHLQKKLKRKIQEAILEISLEEERAYENVCIFFCTDLSFI